MKTLAEIAMWQRQSHQGVNMLRAWLSGNKVLPARIRFDKMTNKSTMQRITSSLLNRLLKFLEIFTLQKFTLIIMLSSPNMSCTCIHSKLKAYILDSCLKLSQEVQMEKLNFEYST